MPSLPARLHYNTGPGTSFQEPAASMSEKVRRAANHALAVTEYRELLIGCGHRRLKELRPSTCPEGWINLTTLDHNPNARADIEWDLDHLPYDFFEDDTFDEIHAYEVLEHCGSVGNHQFFFAQFYEFWRILKPDGCFMASVPSMGSQEQWGDPGHRRTILPMTINYLVRTNYEKALDGTTCLSDYTHWWKGDFNIEHCQTGGSQGERLFFGLRAVKPARKP
jgi:hypothetical protein